MNVILTKEILLPMKIFLRIRHDIVQKTEIISKSFAKGMNNWTLGPKYYYKISEVISHIFILKYWKIKRTFILKFWRLNFTTYRTTNRWFAEITHQDSIAIDQYQTNLQVCFVVFWDMLKLNKWKKAWN